MRMRLPFDRRHGVLMAAIIFGIVGAIGSYCVLNQRIEDFKRKVTATVSVVVAKEDLRDGTALTTETLSSRDIPVEWAQSGAVRVEEFSGIENSRLKGALAKGEMVMWPMVERLEDRVISAVVAKGRRAVTVPVDEISSLSGMFQPGDLIDLIVTTDQQDRPVSFPVMQQARVIATGARMQGAHGSPDAESGVDTGFTTITLDTTPEDARRIIAARDGGRLTAMLRNPDDHLPIGMYRLSLDEISTPAGVRISRGRSDPGSSAKGQTVRIVYGYGE